jgi:hypothetical protein
MHLPQTLRGRVLAVTAGAVAIASVTGAAVAATSSLSTTPPSDARAAEMTFINRTLAPAPTSTRGFDGYQTYVVRAPAGKVILQGFATLSGGLTGSVVIRSTKATPSRYTVKLVFPGEQGRVGRLNVRVQLLPES